MKDIFCFSAPLPLLGRLAEMIILRRYMRALLLERNAVLQRMGRCESGPVDRRTGTKRCVYQPQRPERKLPLFSGKPPGYL